MPPDSFPQQFGPYVFLRVLGVGGMGDVYLALTGKPGLEKPCVVKRLAQHSTPEDVERFRREANLARKLSHGAIAQTLAVDEIDGELVIAQEFLHGCSLSSLLATCLRQREHVPLPLAVHIAREVARALSYAHDQGVTHRDIAPDNVMLTFTGEVRLLDFGIARTATDSRLTRPGWSVGREAYAAPEVAAGGGGDPRSDVYSLGVLLWQLLARRPPPTKEAITPPSTLNPEVPAALDAVVMTAAARDPMKRFQRVEEMVKALGPLLLQQTTGEAEVAAFLRKHYDVTRERDLVDKDIARGRAFLTSGTPASAEDSRRSGPGRRRALIVASCAAAAVVVIVTAFSIRGQRGEPAASESSPSPSRGPSAPSASAPTEPRGERVLPPVPPAKDFPPPTAPASVPSHPGVPAKAIQSSRRARVAGNPQDGGAETIGPDAAANLLADGQRRFDTGDIDGALRSARAAIRAGGGAPAHLLAGRALSKQTQLQDAEREFAIAARLDPTNALAAQRLREVRERLRAAVSAPE
jgi:eukaryotic-like serine/threonine-protein kinase